MAFGDQDAAIFFQDGTVASCRGITTKIHLDYPEDVSQFGGSSLPGAVLSHPSMQYETAKWPDLKSDEVVTVGADTYKVRQSRKLDDGLTSRADLKKGS